MLKAIKRTKTRHAGGRFAIVASKYNARYVDVMLRAARECLCDAGTEKVLVVRVPGAYEIPVVAARLARAHTPPLSAIICLGVILRGARPPTRNTSLRRSATRCRSSRRSTKSQSSTKCSCSKTSSRHANAA